MTTYKKISEDYHIVSVNGDNVIVETHTFTVNGNLDVIGNVTYINTTDLYIDDPFIILANNNSGASPAVAVYGNSGIVTQTSSATYAGLRFHNATSKWQVSPQVYSDGSPLLDYEDIGIASDSRPGDPVGSLQFHDTANSFGGSSDLIWNTGNSSVYHQGHYILGNIGSAPAATANASSIYSAAVGSGGTGVYVKSDTVDDELVSRSKAIVFGIIF